ncbi:MAG: HNH endonuclease signature motif containing protein, partial [Actinomycetes bacterium]
LGRLRLDDPDDPDDPDDGGNPAGGREPEPCLEVEEIDPDTGELLGTRLQRLDAEGEPIDGAAPAAGPSGRTLLPTVRTQPRRLRIGVVVPLSSLLGLSHAPGELPDRSGLIPGEVLRATIADLLQPDARDEVLFTRLLTDDGGRLLDTTELGRYPSRRLAEAIMLRAGTCTFPTCTVPADRCDIDHHQPWPRGETSGRNNDPGCRRHHRDKTHAWQASLRDLDGVDWTMPDEEHYRCRDDPLLTG